MRTGCCPRLSGRWRTSTTRPGAAGSRSRSSTVQALFRGGFVSYDLQAIERGFGEVEADWAGNTVLVRYRADLNNRALIAMKRVMVGVMSLDGTTRFPDVEAIIDELIRVLLPSGPDVPEDERGWDITDGGVSVPINFDTLVDLPP